MARAPSYVRLAHTRRLVQAHQLYFTPTCYAVSTEDRIVSCVACKKVYKVNKADYTAATQYHSHSSAELQALTQVIISQATHTWLQLAGNALSRAYHYTYGTCAKVYTYNKADEIATLTFHLGKYGTRPDAAVSTPEPLTEENVSKTKLATAWNNEQDFMRTTLETIVNGSDALAQAQQPANGSAMLWQEPYVHVTSNKTSLN